MVDDTMIKSQAVVLHRKQFTRGAEHWDIRLDPDYEEFYRQKQREELKVSDPNSFAKFVSINFMLFSY